MRIWDFEYTASNSTHSIAAPGNSGSNTFETRKCLFLAMGLRAVHLVSSNFFGCSAFTYSSFFDLDIVIENVKDKTDTCPSETQSNPWHWSAVEPGWFTSCEG